MKKLLLHEDMFFDIPNVDYKLDTELELKGPEPGEDVGVSGLLLDLIGDVAKNINDYNQLQANLENYPEVAEMIKDFADEENMKLGKIQSALKTISPNAEYIMNGAVEADQEMDPGSPIDESLRRLNEADRPDGAPINFWEPGGEDAEEYYQTNILTDMFDADPSRFEQALEDFGYNPTNYDNFDSFLKDVDKVDLLNKFADLLQKNDELNSSWYDHFDFTEAPLPFDFDESLNESTNFVNKDVINLLNDYFRNHLRADNTWAEIDSVEVVGKDTYKVEVHFKGINTYSTVDSDGYRYTEYEDTDEYKTYVVKVDGNYVSIISNESLKEDFEDYEDRLFYRKSDRLENSVEKRFPGWKIFVEGSWQCGIGSDFIYIYPPDDIKLEDDPLSIYLDGSFLDISNREILKLIAQEIKPVIQANESLKEDFDPKSYNQALDDYMSSKNISVEKLFGALNYDDPRYKQLFNSLKDLGYKPRETGTYSRGYFVPAMTITVSTRKVPDDVIDLIHKLAGVTGRHIGFHKGANNWKLKFELRDDDFSSFRDKLLQSLNEQDEIEENLKEDDAVDDDNFLTEGFLHIVKE